jgi:hypothetical protein
MDVDRDRLDAKRPGGGIKRAGKKDGHGVIRITHCSRNAALRIAAKSAADVSDGSLH